MAAVGAEKAWLRAEEAEAWAVEAARVARAEEAWLKAEGAAEVRAVQALTSEEKATEKAKAK